MPGEGVPSAGPDYMQEESGEESAGEESMAGPGMETTFDYPVEEPFRGLRFGIKVLGFSSVGSWSYL